MAGKTDENVAIEVFLGSLRSLAVLVRKSQPRFVRRIFFVERRAMSRSAPLRRTRAIDDNHRRYATCAYIRTWIRIEQIHAYIHTHIITDRQYIQIRPPWPILHEEIRASVSARKSYGATGRLHPGASILWTHDTYTRARVYVHIYTDTQTWAYIKPKAYRIRTDRSQRPSLGVVATRVLPS